MALSTGCIALYELKLSGNSHLEYVDNLQFFTEEALVLSLGVSPISTCMVSTLSTGEVSIVDMAQETPQQKEAWKAHDLEVWCSAWKSADTIITGGDDSLLKLWDLRDKPQNPQTVCTRSV